MKIQENDEREKGTFAGFTKEQLASVSRFNRSVINHAKELEKELKAARKKVTRCGAEQEETMNKDLRTWSDSDLTRLLHFTENLSEQINQKDYDFDDLNEVEKNAKEFAERRRKGYRNVANPDDAGIREQVRTYLKRKKIIKD